MTASASPALDALLEQLGSLDASDRLEAINQVRKYAAHRKVKQAVFELRNDPDRRIRDIAREILDEAERRTSESLSVAGSVDAEANELLEELLKDLTHPQPFERVKALKQLRLMPPNARIDKAVLGLKRDPDRTVRLMVEQMLEEKAKAVREGERPAVNDFQDGVLVASPYSKKAVKSGKEAAADRLGPEMVPYVGFGYLVLGLPLAAASLWMWLFVQGYLRPDQAPDPAMQRGIAEVLGVNGDPLMLALLLTMSALQAISGLGMMFRQEWARKGILLFHALLAFGGLFLPSVWLKLAPGMVAGVVLYFLTRHEIVKSFKGHDAGKPKGPPANYGSMDRKTW